MPHISLPAGIPGIVSLFQYRPDTGNALNELAELLLRGESPLSQGERELIASYISYSNECKFCSSIHGAIARELLQEKSAVVDAVKEDIETADISDKMKALLKIAGQVQVSGKQVSSDDIQQARKQGATDMEIHDTVLIAAAFCMYNRYVDGLATLAPDDPTAYEQMAGKVVESGYTYQKF